MTRAWDNEKSEYPTGIEPMTFRTPGGAIKQITIFQRRSQISLRRFSCGSSVYPGRIGIWRCWFLWKKTRKPRENPQKEATTNNKHNPRIAPAGQDRTWTKLTIPAPRKNKLNITNACESISSISSNALASVRAYSVNTGRFLVTASKVGVILWTWKRCKDRTFIEIQTETELNFVKHKQKKTTER